MSTPQLTYRTFLEQEFIRRRRKNPSYSLRAFARDLEIPAPKLSQALRGIRGMSVVRARQITQKLHLSKSESDLFVSLVEAEHGRSESAKISARQNVQVLQKSAGFGELSLELFQIIRDWYHFAILELTDVCDFEGTPSWIAKKLRIKPAEAKVALQKLLDFGLLKEDLKRGFIQTKADLATPSEIPSREIREHHSQILQQADLALQTTSVEERDFSAITMAIDSKRIEEAKSELRKFRRKFCADLQSAGEKDRVYCLGIQFFPLDRESK